MILGITRLLLRDGLSVNHNFTVLKVTYILDFDCNKYLV
jgi:hypothetical protein